MFWVRGHQTFSIKEEVAISGSAGCLVSVATAQHCFCNLKAAIDNMERNGYGCVPIKLFFTKIGGGLDLVQGPELLSPALSLCGHSALS